MNLAEVNVRGEMMARGHAKKIAPTYRDDVLGPLARRVEAQPEGSDDDDPGTNKRNLEALLASLGPNALADMRTDRLAESLTEASVQAFLIGRLAVPKLPEEPKPETAASSASRTAGVVAQRATTPPVVGGRNNGQHRRPRTAAHANTEVTMPEQVTPQQRLSQLIRLLGMDSDATADDVVNKLASVLKLLDMDYETEGGEGGAVLKKAMQLLGETAEDRRNGAITQAQAEYRLDPGMKLTACSGHVNHTLREKHMPLLSNDERQQIDVVVPDQR